MTIHLAILFAERFIFQFGNRLRVVRTKGITNIKEYLGWHMDCLMNNRSQGSPLMFRNHPRIHQTPISHHDQTYTEQLSSHTHWWMPHDYTSPMAQIVSLYSLVPCLL